MSKQANTTPEPYTELGFLRECARDQARIASGRRVAAGCGWASWVECAEAAQEAAERFEAAALKAEEHGARAGLDWRRAYHWRSVEAAARRLV